MTKVKNSLLDNLIDVKELLKDKKDKEEIIGLLDNVREGMTEGVVEYESKSAVGSNNQIETYALRAHNSLSRAIASVEDARGEMTKEHPNYNYSLKKIERLLETELFASFTKQFILNGDRDRADGKSIGFSITQKTEGENE